MITLSYGYLLPENPDTGDVFFPALETDIQQLNDHDHDGSNSAPLASITQTAASASWVATSNGLYRQLMTAPAGFSVFQAEIWLTLSTGEQVYGGISRQSSSTFYIYTNDNTKTYTVYYR